MENFDLEQFAKLFDTAMTSKNPAVQKALKNLLIVSAIAEAKGEEFIGPLETMFNSVRELKKRVDILEQTKYNNYGNNSYTITTTPYISTGTSTTATTSIWGYDDTISITVPSDDLVKVEEC